MNDWIKYSFFFLMLASCFDSTSESSDEILSSSSLNIFESSSSAMSNASSDAALRSSDSEPNEDPLSLSTELLSKIESSSLAQISSLELSLSSSSSSDISLSSFLVVVFSSSEGLSSNSITSSSIDVSSSSILELDSGSFVDVRDGQSYRYKKIGTQIWMAENLNYDSQIESYCFLGETSNCDIYGRLYTWYAAMNGGVASSSNPSGVQGVCPVGWHLPSSEEWNTLGEFVSVETGFNYPTTNGWAQIGMNLKSTIGWTSLGFDDYGFTALPAGLRFGTGTFKELGESAKWWSTSEESSTFVYYWALYSIAENFDRSSTYKSMAISVRCVKN